MALQTSGQISLNDLHVEAGGTSGTQASMNDTDIRGLVSAAANSQMTFSSFYGASSSILSTTMTIGSYTDSSGYSGTDSGYNDTSISCLSGASWGSLANSSVNSIQSGAIISQINHNSINAAIQLVFGDNTVMSNSGWTSLTIGSTTLNRTAATFSQATTAISGYEYRALWTWSSQGATPPFGTSGTVSVTIV
jgi:hypothetical protein